MRITIVMGPWLPVPALQGGSVPRMWHGLAEEFTACGHDVLVMARSFPGQPRYETQKGVRFERRGGFGQTRAIYVNLAKDLIYAMGLLPRLPRADMLVINDFWLPILASRFRPEAGRVVVSANRFPKGQYRFYGKVACIVAASRAVERAIIEQTPAVTGRVRCIPNPLDTCTFVPPIDGRSQRPAKTILYVGRLHPEKAVDVLIDAFAKIWMRRRDVSLRIIGPSASDQGGGGERYLRELARLAEGLPVSLRGPEFDVSRLARAYQEADLFCYPSMAEKGEALPVAPLEAMSTGLPVIVSSLECFSDFLTSGENGLQFDHRAGDPAAELARVLEHALVDWEETLEIGRRGITTAHAFSFPGIANKFLEEFERLLGTKI